MSESHENYSSDQLIDMALAPMADAKKVDERRIKKRYAYLDLVGIMLLDEAGKTTDSLVLRAKNLSRGGIFVSSRIPIELKTRGILQLVRSTGSIALTGVVVMHCQYVSEMEHEVGFRFIPMPHGREVKDFVNKEGAVALFDPLLKNNIGKK